ncbi:MBL fold metallo-hydrolase [Vulgatibacter incomptus]|nr:MBL fold metallo-hydrolase [Vulgatibacter incomptus]
MPERGGDAAIARLGVHRIPIPLPFPQAGGPVNVIAVEEEGGGIALFDTGIGGVDAEAVLRSGLAAIGSDLGEVRRIFVTHGHVDHYGQASRVREVSGAPVYVHARDRRKLLSPVHWIADRELYEEFLRRCGVPAASVREILEVAAYQEHLGGRLEEPLGELAEGQQLSFARCDATLLEMPGHTPGLVCALLSTRGGAGGPLAVLLANDHILEHVSPNPLLEILRDGSRFRALPTYLESAARARALELDWVVPGHGACFVDHRRVIDGLEGFYARRQEKILSLIPAGGATPVELVLSLFPRATGLDTYLVIGEILGNLDLLEADSRVGAIERHGELRYFRR